MQNVPRIALTGNETTAELTRLGLTNRHTRWRARRDGYYYPQPYWQREYPQHEGPGGYQAIEHPLFFVKKIILREVKDTRRYIDPAIVNEWIQEALCRMWERRHAPHVEHWSSYYFAMVRGMVRQWIVKYKREAERRIPLFKESHLAKETG